MDEIDGREYRNTVGLFATGVTIVATEVDGETHAMTANAVTSLSLDPTLIIVCVGKTARTVGYLEAGNPFCFSILTEAQEDLSSFFAGMWDEEKDPPNFEFEATAGGPRLKGSLGAIGCVPHQTLDGGDHLIVIGRVVDLHTAETTEKPLLFYRGRYAKLA